MSSGMSSRKRQVSEVSASSLNTRTKVARQPASNPRLHRTVKCDQKEAKKEAKTSPRGQFGGKGTMILGPYGPKTKKAKQAKELLMDTTKGYNEDLDGKIESDVKEIDH
eukprot:1333182-Amorphochlora_amoeboformis.AAC.2